MEVDTVYFERRASEERAAALHARHAKVREAHLQMAERYEDLARAIRARERVMGLHASNAARREPAGPPLHSDL